jgi:chaperone modulatory protein CbpM
VNTPPPTLVLISGTALRAQMHLSGKDLAAAAGISRAGLARLVRLGLVEPIAPGASQFTAATVARLRRMVRLHDDLGVNFAHAAIIADLLERLERLETELARGTGAP